MPPVKKPQIPTEEIDSKELEKLERAVTSKSEAPTVADLTPDTNEFRRMRDELGPPFNAERITLLQRRQLRKDPMIAFGLHYRKVPIARAEYYIDARDRNGPNPQVAAFVDQCLRIIYTSYIFQRTLALDFGYQATVKQWQFANPGGVFLDRIDLDENGQPTVKPVWDEGTVLPKIWRTFQTLPPERVTPRFIESGPNEGSFDGIDYELPPQARARSKGTFRATSSRRGGRKQTNIRQISVYNSLWATHQKWDELGSLYGYPLTGYARDYWWDYIFVAGLQRRAFERIALPPIKAWHPPGSSVVDELSGAKARNVDIMLDMAERLRSNAVAAFPSTMAETEMGEKSSTHRAWDAVYMETPKDTMEIFDRARNYFNVMKLRAIWVPELAFVGRESGNSGGNIAGTMQEIFTASQELLMAEILEEIVRYMIPHLLWLNFPEFVNNGGKARIISKGFRSEDMDLIRQLIQLFGQADPRTLADIDTRELLRRAGMPLRDAAELAAERKALTERGINSAPPLVEPQPGQIGVIRNPNFNPGYTNGGSVPNPAAAGFSSSEVIYTAGPEQVEVNFADNVDGFLASLPDSKHYQDRAIRALTVQLRRLWSAHFRRLYPELAKFISKADLVKLSEDAEEVIELADRNVPDSKAEKIAKSILKQFKLNSRTLNELADRTRIVLRKMIDRGIKLDERKTRLNIEVDESAIDNFLESQIGRLIKLSHKTFEDEVRQHLINEIKAGKSASEIADNLVGRFENMPITKAERIARSETRDAVNAATLIAGEGAAIRYVRAKDGEKFDAKCRERNNKLLTIREAWKEMRDEHPYGSLGFELIPRANLSIEWVDEIEGDQVAYFDDSESTIYLSRMLDDDAAQQYLNVISDHLINSSNGHKETV